MNNPFDKYHISPNRLGILRNLMMMTTGATVIVALIFGIGLWRVGARFFGQVTTLFNTPQPAPEVDVRSLIVQQVQEVSDLTTAVFTMEAVVPTRQARTLGGYPIAETTLLYIAYGEVRAGVDLAQLKPDNVQIANDTLQVQLPPPKILDSKIDVNRSQVYDYDRGFLGLGPDTAPQLQMLAQQETLKKIVFNACEQGLLERANHQAERVVEQLLTTAGYKQVQVNTQSPLAGTCPLSLGGAQ